MENRPSVVALARRPANDGISKEFDATSMSSGNHAVAVGWVSQNKSSQNLRRKDETGYSDQGKGHIDEWDSETIFTSRHSSSYDVSTHHYDSNQTPYETEDDQECYNGLSDHACRIFLSTPDKLGLDDFCRSAVTGSSSTLHLSRSTSAGDVVDLASRKSGDGLTSRNNAGLDFSNHKRSAVAPPPSRSSLSSEDGNNSTATIPEAPNQHGMASRSPDGEAISSSSDTIPTFESNIAASERPQEPPAITTRPRLPTQSSHRSSNSSFSISILPSIPRLYYNNSSHYSSQYEIQTGLCTILTNPLNRLKARKRSVKESAAMDAELREAHAEMRRKEMSFRQEETQPPQYSDSNAAERGEDAVCETSEQGR
jgi:hypothetical protein